MFGDWGSGKSFFMRAIRERVEAIEQEIQGTNRSESPFWKNISQIEFNAWEYGNVRSRFRHRRRQPVTDW